MAIPLEQSLDLNKERVTAALVSAGAVFTESMRAWTGTLVEMGRVANAHKLRLLLIGVVAMQLTLVACADPYTLKETDPKSYAERVLSDYEVEKMQQEAKQKQQDYFAKVAAPPAEEEHRMSDYYAGGVFMYWQKMGSVPAGGGVFDALTPEGGMAPSEYPNPPEGSVEVFIIYHGPQAPPDMPPEVRDWSTVNSTDVYPEDTVIHIFLKPDDIDGLKKDHPTMQVYMNGNLPN